MKWRSFSLVGTFLEGFTNKGAVFFVLSRAHLSRVRFLQCVLKKKTHHLCTRTRAEVSLRSGLGYAS
jgi:hypothetical protein